MVQAPAAEEPDASAFSQMLTPAAAAQHDGTSAPEPAAVPKEGEGLVGVSEHRPGGEPARHTSTADVLDYRERLTGCADPIASTGLQPLTCCVDVAHVGALDACGAASAVLGKPWCSLLSLMASV